MTTFELNAEIYHNLSFIANDENKLKKVLSAIKRIIRSGKKEVQFPHIDAGFKISDEVMNGAIGPLPKNTDFETETKHMWEDLAK